MTRKRGSSQTTLHLMQAERRHDKVTQLRPRSSEKPIPKRSADILPFVGYRYGSPGSIN